MALKSTFTPKASLTEAPTNLKEAIDWVLRVTGKDGKELNKETECICGLAAAVTDLLQSVELEYNGYQGDTKEDDAKKGATKQQVEGHLNELFSLVQGLGGTAVVRTYIDQLAQVLSALVGWSKLDKCGKGCGGTGDDKPHGGSSCGYLNEVTANEPCAECKCMKWKESKPGEEGLSVGRGCRKCKDSSGSRDACKCGTGGGCKGSSDQECQCAKEGKCCKCCCKDKCSSGCAGEKAKCSCDGYKSAYCRKLKASYVEVGIDYSNPPTWKDLLIDPPGITSSGTSSHRRQHCARILLGSVCLIWSGITYMYWTGKWATGSPYWNNHILDGSGLDDGTLSQWLQALGFPKTMLNDAGPGNRLDAVIWDGLSDKLLLGFAVPSGLIGSVAKDEYGNTARGPGSLNYPGLVHTIHRDSFNNDGAIVFKNGGSSTSSGSVPDQNKLGPLFKLYILSCAYFTGLQKKAPPKAGNTTPKTIRDILYWLSALPYSQAYPEILKHGKDRLEKVLKKPDGSGSTNGETQLKFFQDKRPKPITVDEYNLFAHFQAVTQYCPLVLIGIQGGLKGADSTKEPAIHSLYANTECSFTYPTVSIQAYNQVVHYIRALFYQLYFLRKQCAVKVALGGKWRECRYGHGVESKGVISWMCLGCNPMEHDRKCRVEKVMGELKVVPQGNSKELVKALKDVLEKIGDVVVQLGNAQEVLEKDVNNEGVAVAALKKVSGVSGSDLKGVLDAVLEEVNKKVEALKTVVEKKVNELGALEGEKKKALDTAKDAVTKATTALTTAKEKVKSDNDRKNKLNAAHHGIRVVVDALLILKEWWNNIKTKGCQRHLQDDIANAIDNIENIVGSTRCVHCKDHSTKCGQPSNLTVCPTCHQPTTTGVPSPLQAFLEDRLPGFSCESTKEWLDKQEADRAQKGGKDAPPSSALEYPPAASHLGHCNGSGQCCPLPMGFRNNFCKGGISDCTGARLYGILYFFSNGDMMQSCVYTLVRVTAALSATTPQVLGDVFGFFRGGIGNKEEGMPQEGNENVQCDHTSNPKATDKENKTKYFCGWCASGLRDEVQKIEWIPKDDSKKGGKYRTSVGTALIEIKGDKGSAPQSPPQSNNTSLSRLTKNCQYLSPLTGELYTAVSATFGGTYLSWVLYLSDALQWGLKSLASEFKQIECRGCIGCDPNKCRKGSHGTNGESQCRCQSIVSCTGVLPVLYRHGFSYGNPFNLEGFQQGDGKVEGDYSITDKQEGSTKKCHQFLSSINAVIKKNTSQQDQHPLTNLLSQVGKLQYDIRLPWIFVLTVAWLVAVLYLAFGAIWPLDWTHMRSHWLRGGEHQWQCMWYKVMTGRKGVELMEYFGRR